MPLPRSTRDARQPRDCHRLIHPIRYRCLPRCTCTASMHRTRTHRTKREREREIKTCLLLSSFGFDQFDAYSPRLRIEVSPVGMLNFNLPRVTRSYYLSFGTAISEPVRKVKAFRSVRNRLSRGYDRLTTNKRREISGFY